MLFYCLLLYCYNYICMYVYMYACMYVYTRIILDYTIILENLKIMDNHNTHNPAIPKCLDIYY